MHTALLKIKRTKNRYSFAFDAIDTTREVELTLTNSATPDADRSVFFDGLSLCDTCLIVHNSDFEADVHNLGFVAQTPNSWTSTGNTLIVENGNPWGDNLTTPFGYFYAALQPGATISQTVFGLVPFRT